MLNLFEICQMIEVGGFLPGERLELRRSPRQIFLQSGRKFRRIWAWGAPTSGDALTTWPSGQSQLKSRISQQLSQNPTFFLFFCFFLQFDVWALLPHHHLLQVPAMTPRTTASVSGVSCQIDSERFKSPIDAPFVAT
jgi:hypothetical protein